MKKRYIIPTSVVAVFTSCAPYASGIAGSFNPFKLSDTDEEEPVAPAKHNSWTTWEED